MTKPVIACDVGASNVRVEWFDERLQSGYETSAHIVGLTYSEVLEQLRRCIEDVANSRPNFEAIGLSMAGHVDTATGTVSQHPLGADPGRFETHAICARFGEIFGVPIALENDGNAACIAEWSAGAARGAQNVVSLTVGTFVGSGVVLQGKLLRRRTSGVSVGAIIFNSEDTYDNAWSGCGGYNIGQIATEEFGCDTTCEELFAMASSGNLRALEIFYKAGRGLGRLVTSAANMFEPEIIVLTGSVMNAASLLMPPALEVFEQFRLPSTNEYAKIVLGHYGHRAGIIGAAVLAQSGQDSNVTTTETARDFGGAGANTRTAKAASRQNQQPEPLCATKE